MKLKQWGGLGLVALLLTACGTPAPKQPGAAQPSGPTARPMVPAVQGGGYLSGDGPGEQVPSDLDSVPDATPRAEPLHPYANRPYSALGKNYVPLTKTGVYRARGIASWYGKKFHGQRTSSGEVYDMFAMTAAHTTLPIPSYARVTNVSTGKSVVVRVNDRGPFLHERVMDLSYAAAHKLGLVGNGSAEVEVVSLGVEGGVEAAPLAQAAPVSTEALAPAAPISAAPIVPAAPVAAAPSAGTGGASATEPTPAHGVFLQFGAFRSQAAADSFMAHMQDEYGMFGKTWYAYVKGDGYVRVQLGPYADVASARSEADKLHGKVGFKPMVSTR